MPLHLPVFQKRASFFMLTAPSDVLIFVMPFTKACVDLSPEITVRALTKLPHLSLTRTLTVQPPHFHLTVHEHGGLSPFRRLQGGSSWSGGSRSRKSTLTAGGQTRRHRRQSASCLITQHAVRAAVWVDSPCLCRRPGWTRSVCLFGGSTARECLPTILHSVFV